MTQQKPSLLDIIKMTPKEIESLTGFSEKDTDAIKAQKEAHDAWLDKMPWRGIK